MKRMAKYEEEALLITRDISLCSLQENCMLSLVFFEMLTNISTFH